MYAYSSYLGVSFCACKLKELRNCGEIRIMPVRRSRRSYKIESSFDEKNERVFKTSKLIYKAVNTLWYH